MLRITLANGAMICSTVNGWGAQVSHDLRLHVGEFEDGLAHGAGIVTHADGRVESAVWWRGVLQQLS